MAKGSHNIDGGGRVHKDMICVDTDIVGTSYIRASGWVNYQLKLK